MNMFYHRMKRLDVAGERRDAGAHPLSIRFEPEGPPP